MPEPTPDFTILMPTRNHGPWIEQAVRSVLEQEFPGTCELLVLDALSHDNTAEVMQRHAGRLVWRRQADAGQADAINQGLRLARGRVIGWLNSDDVYLPGTFAAIAEAFARDPGLDFVYGDALEIDAAGNILTPNLFTEDCVPGRFYTSHDYICQPTLFFRREAAARVGPLRTKLRWFLDYEWFSRFFQAGLRGLRLPRFLAANRDHPATKTNSGGFPRWWEIMQVLADNPGPFVLLRRCGWIYSLELVIKWLNATEPKFFPARWRQTMLDSLNRGFMRLVSPRSFADIVRRYEHDILSRGRTITALWVPPPTDFPGAAISAAAGAEARRWEQGAGSDGRQNPGAATHRAHASTLSLCSNAATAAPAGVAAFEGVPENVVGVVGGSVPRPTESATSAEASAATLLAGRIVPLPQRPAPEPLAPNLAQKYPALTAELHAALRTLLFPELPDCAGRDALLAKLLGTSISEATYVLAALHQALRVPGDVVEFGIAQGATSALLANELRNTGRTLWLYDSFAGLPAPSPQDELKDDIFLLGSISRYQGEMACPRTEVEERLRRIGIPGGQVRIVPGFIEKTLPQSAPAAPGAGVAAFGGVPENVVGGSVSCPTESSPGATAPSAVAFAYVDLDFHAPIKTALEFLDQHLSVGGRIVVDDYDFFSTGARKAVDEFIARRGESYAFHLPPPFAGHFCLMERVR